MHPRSIGSVTISTPSIGLTQYSIRLNRPVPGVEPEAAHDCLFITRSLHAVDRWDYLRLTGSIVLPAHRHLNVRFLNLPVMEWMGYGRLSKKLIQVVELVAIDGVPVDWIRFADLVTRGISYPKVTTRKVKKK